MASILTNGGGLGAAFGHHNAIQAQQRRVAAGEHTGQDHAKQRDPYVNLRFAVENAEAIRVSLYNCVPPGKPTS